MLPVVFILIFVVIIGFIVFAVKKKQSGEDLGERKSGNP